MASWTVRSSHALRLALVLGAGALAPGSALAGGSGENLLLIIDPSNPESLYIGNYYKDARGIPDANVLYVDPDHPSYQDFAGQGLDAFLGELAQRRIGDHIDFVLVTPGNGFFVSAPGLVNDGCFPVTRFAIASCYTMAHLKAEILAGNVPVSRVNNYFSTNTAQPIAFDSNTAYLGGSPSTNAAARRYYLGAMLGYSGPRGNTPAETIAMIDRSVAADGARPAGTHYYMNNTGDPPRNVRQPQFPSAITLLTGLGATGVQITGALPSGMQDCLSVMSGFASADILGANLTLVPGSFADHLTSYAATFDEGSQTKLSDWIRKGASGSLGAVQEPCNYTGKFPAARQHAFYAQGMALGEAYFRGAQFVPFQMLLYGDPLTRPFAHIPVVSVPNAPGRTVSGVVALTPQATTTHPSAIIAGFDLFVDGVFQRSITPGASFSIDTARLADGRHDVRIHAFDSSLTRTVGRWLGTLTTSNAGRSAILGVAPASGNLTKVFQFDVGAGGGGTVGEVRLRHNGRIVAARQGLGPLFVWGQTFGAGPVRVFAEIDYTDGKMAISPPVDLSIDFANGAVSGLNPVAFAYTKVVHRGAPAVVELPSTLDTDPTQATWTVVAAPSQGTLAPGTGPYRVLTPNAGACGQDTLVFRVNTGAGQSGNATVKLVYTAPNVACRPDIDGSGVLNVGDYIAFQTRFALGSLDADFDNNCVLNVSDYIAFQTGFALGCN